MMKRIILSVVTAALMSGCATTYYDEDGNKVMKTYSARVGAAYLDSKNLELMKDVTQPCSQDVSGWAPAAQAEHARSCGTMQLVAMATGRPLSPQGEVAYAQVQRDKAFAQASAAKWRVGGNVLSLGLGLYGIGLIAEKVAANAGHNTYNANGNTFSQSVNGNMAGAGGVPGEGELGGGVGGAFDASGTRTQSLVVGGDSNFGIVDKSPSAVLQPNLNIGEKPNAVDATGPYTNNDSDGNGNETSLF